MALQIIKRLEATMEPPSWEGELIECAMRKHEYDDEIRFTILIFEMDVTYAWNRGVLHRSFPEILSTI